MIILIANTNHFFCQDGLLRDFAGFGSYPGCVKVYKSLGWARRIAKRYGLRVIQIPNTMAIDMAGTVIETIHLDNEYVQYKHHKMNEFVVF